MKEIRELIELIEYCDLRLKQKISEQAYIDVVATKEVRADLIKILKQKVEQL